MECDEARTLARGAAPGAGHRRRCHRGDEAARAAGQHGRRSIRRRRSRSPGPRAALEGARSPGAGRVRPALRGRGDTLARAGPGQDDARARDVDRDRVSPVAWRRVPDRPRHRGRWREPGDQLSEPAPCHYRRLLRGWAPGAHASGRIVAATGRRGGRAGRGARTPDGRPPRGRLAGAVDTMTALWLGPLIAIVLTQIAVIATSTYLHRALAHRSLDVHPAADVMFRIVLWLMTGQDRREWVAVHRKHHAFTDREGDPHSPSLRGFWHVQFLNAYYYAREANNPETIRRFAADIPQDRLDRAVFSRGWSGLALGTTLLCLLLGLWPGLVAAGVHAVLYVFVVAPLINGLGHWRGAKNFSNTAYNSRVLAWMT